LPIRPLERTRDRQSSAEKSSFLDYAKHSIDIARAAKWILHNAAAGGPSFRETFDFIRREDRKYPPALTATFVR